MESDKSKQHENIRVNVSNMIKEIFLEVLNINNNKNLILLKMIVENIPISDIIHQEVYIPEKREAVDAVFAGGLVIFEFKSSPKEFEEAYNNALNKYYSKIKNARYFIITDYNQWRIYRIESTMDTNKVNLKLLNEGDRETAKTIIKTQIIPEILNEILSYKNPLIPATPASVSNLFKIRAGDHINTIKKIFNSVKSDPRVEPLYSAYTTLMKTLYSNSTSSVDFEDLFVKHTLMHMIVLASLAKALDKNGKPEDLCSGIEFGVDVALPYLNWWRVIYREEKYKSFVITLKDVLEEIVAKVNLIGWTDNTREDIFRLLYELLVDPKTRRNIGEYYTPLWLVEYILNEFDLREKVVLDPFCGSGTFLTLAFHKKVDSGEDPDKAYSEIVGFDINPLAIAIARSELILAYVRRTGKKPEIPPHIYHVDTLAILFEGKQIIDPKFKHINELADNLMKLESDIDNMHILLKSLTEIENTLTRAMNYAYIECGLDEKRLSKSIKKYMYIDKDDHKNSTQFFRTFLEHAKSVRLYKKLAKLIIGYKGNSVWAVVIVSLYAPYMIMKLKPDIVVTNPPWINMAEFKTSYADKIREEAKTLVIRELGISKDKATNIITGSDIAAMALHKFLYIAREGVGFIMNREQAFYHKSSMPAGILLTYCILKHKIKETNHNVDYKLIDIDYDAFEHGIYPTVIISTHKSKLSVIKLNKEYRKNYNKDIHLTEDLLDSVELYEDYNNYIAPSIDYFKTEPSKLANIISAKRVVPMGLYIRGLFGGEKKNTNIKYAGLVLQKLDYTNSEVKLRLYNTQHILKIPKDWLKMFNVNIYNVIYVGMINPFKLRDYYKVLLSSDEDCLKEFLKKTLEANETNLTTDDISKIRTLINELKQSKINTLNPNNYYVIYRADRIFTATTLIPADTLTVVSSNVGFIEFDSNEKAYFYTAILNYLVYNVIQQKRSFIRHQLSRPIRAIDVSNLTWDKVDENIKNEIINLSINISNNKTIINREYNYQKKAIEELKNICEFKKLVNILDSNVNKDKLQQALKFVSGG